MLVLTFTSIDTDTIVDYYNNEDNNTNNPTCPRDVVIPQGIVTLGNSVF